MKPVALLASVACMAAAWVAPANAQDMHSLGDAAFSADGSHLAFHVQGRPKTEFMVLEVASGRSFRFALPAAHIEMRDIGWSQTGDTLMFVSLNPTSMKMRDPFILGGRGTHVWSVEFNHDGPQPAKVLAIGEGFRWPALSRDGTKLAYFLPVPLPREEPPNSILSPDTYGVFEKDLATGETTRVSKMQWGIPRKLFYDGADAWLLSADEMKYVHQMGQSQFWSAVRPGAPSGAGSFDQLTDGIKSFRMARGDELPQYPDHMKPYPPIGVAPVKSALVRVAEDGRPILFGAPGAENTAANQLRNTASWYVSGVSRVEMKEGYLAFGADGVRQEYFPPKPPAAYDGNVGGIAVDGQLKRYAAIAMKIDRKKPDFGRSSARLFLFEGDVLKIERDISEMADASVVLQIAEPAPAGDR